MKLSYSKKILILSALVFIGVVVLDVIFTNLLLNKIIGINDKVKQLTISSQERERNFILQDLVTSTKTERIKLEQSFVGVGDINTAEFIRSLELLAKSYSVTLVIKSVGYEPVPEMASSEVVSLIKFKVNVIGKWDNVYGFLGKMENLSKVAMVTGVTFDANAGFEGGKNQSKSWSADIDFSVVKLKR
jgi:uncharacterized membrane protein